MEYIVQYSERYGEFCELKDKISTKLKSILQANLIKINSRSFASVRG